MTSRAIKTTSAALVESNWGKDVTLNSDIKFRVTQAASSLLLIPSCSFTGCCKVLDGVYNVTVNLSSKNKHADILLKIICSLFFISWLREKKKWLYVLDYFFSTKHSNVFFPFWHLLSVMTFITERGEELFLAY